MVQSANFVHTQVPVTLICGFLGSGKTSLVNAILSAQHRQRIVIIANEHPEASAQIASADHIVLKHCDRCPPKDLDRAEVAVRSCNPNAVVQRTSHARVDVASWLATRTWDTVWGLDRHAGYPDDTASMSAAHHTHGVGALSLHSERPVDLNRLQAWLRGIFDDLNTDIMRIKGMVRCPQYAEMVIVQGVYQWCDMRLGDACKPQVSMLVLIGRGLNREAMLRSWANCQITPEG